MGFHIPCMHNVRSCQAFVRIARATVLSPYQPVSSTQTVTTVDGRHHDTPVVIMIHILNSWLSQ